MLDLNFLERAVAAVNPHWGLRRLSHKLALDEARTALRNYDAARRDRRTAGWRATGGSANAEIGPALDTIRRRTRDMIRNNEWAANGHRKLTAHIVGTGFTMRPAAATPKATKKKAVECWSEFVETCDPSGQSDFNGFQAQSVGEVVAGGAAFLRWYVRPPEWNLRVPIQCEALEHDYLDTRKNEANDERIIVNGVEYDHFGRRVAYWFFPHHPGEVSVLSRGRFQSERVPASEVDHIFRVDRPGQVTGVPWFAPLLLRLRDVSEYEEAEQIRKKIAACFTVVVTRGDTGASNLVQANQQAKDEQGRRIEKIAPGLISYLNQGDGIVTATPPADTGHVDHMTWQLMAAAAGLGLTFAQMTGNLKGVNYSSLREGKLDFWQVLDQWQWLMVAPQLCNKAWRRVMAASAGRGGVPTPHIGLDVTPPKRPWVDPLKDAKAEENEMVNGLETWSDKVSARGYDPDEQIEKLKRDRERLAEVGIVIGQTPGPVMPTQQESDNGDETE